jgi:nucleotide-binding universal stress UspA family protein
MSGRNNVSKLHHLWQLTEALCQRNWTNLNKYFKFQGSVSCRLLHAGGSAGEVIMKFVKEENANLIIIGSRGMGIIRRTVLGSVSDYVVHHANTPVIVVPPK